MRHDSSGDKILIVDDVPLNLKLLGNILKEAGYDVAFAKSGEDAPPAGTPFHTGGRPAG